MTTFADALAASPDLFARLLPTVYFNKHLALTPPLRPSSLHRALTGFRTARIHIGALQSCAGSAVVRIGHSVVACGITPYLVSTDTDVAACGTLFTNVDVAGRRDGMPLAEYVALSRWLFTTANGVGLYEPTDLRVLNPIDGSETGLAFALQAQIQVFAPTAPSQPPQDVVWACLISALASTMIPRLALAPEDDINFITAATAKFSHVGATKLQLQYDIENLPWCVNFGIAHPSGLVLADLDGRVEEVSVDGHIMIIACAPSANDMQDEPKLVAMELSTGLTDITRAQIQQCISLTQKRAYELSAILKTQLQR
ncbi:uncharacterized protein V1518DRAFT_413851 [Limtongia smithiae]|uniref:uncharacterized protein n=1 Tax=Limtongia smithiae TaxID=1125753 RepID=UPI0034CE6221